MDNWINVSTPLGKMGPSLSKQPLVSHPDRSSQNGSSQLAARRTADRPPTPAACCRPRQAPKHAARADRPANTFRRRQRGSLITTPPPPLQFSAKVPPPPPPPPPPPLLLLLLFGVVRAGPGRAGPGWGAVGVHSSLDVPHAGKHGAAWTCPNGTCSVWTCSVWTCSIWTCSVWTCSVWTCSAMDVLGHGRARPGRARPTCWCP